MADVAIVVLDTLRKDAFDDHFDWLPGLRFENVWSPSHWTVPAHAALFAGKYPSELGVYANAESLDCPEPVLAELASHAGYTTRAFSANGNISDHFLFNRGFDVFAQDWRAEGWKDELRFRERNRVFDWKRYNAQTDREGLVRRIGGVAQCVFGEYDTLPSLRHGYRRWMRGPGSPKLSNDPPDYGSTKAIEFVRETNFGDKEFLFINLMEAHNPYKPPEEYRTVEPVRIHGLKALFEGPGADPEHIRQAYDDCVRYLSDRYEELFDELSASFDYIVTLSDHGELLGEQGQWEHLCGLQPELTHVPMVISGDTGGVCDATVSVLDVHRTILDVLSVEAGSRGINLLGDVEPHESLTEFHGFSRLHTGSLEEPLVGRLESMDRELHGIATPESYYGYETFDGFESVGETGLDDPRARMAELVAELERRDGHPEEYDDLPDELLERLRDLGYA